MCPRLLPQDIGSGHTKMELRMKPHLPVNGEIYRSFNCIARRDDRLTENVTSGRYDNQKIPLRKEGGREGGSVHNVTLLAVLWLHHEHTNY